MTAAFSGFVPDVFGGLHGVYSEQLDRVMADFTADQWTALEQGFLDQVSMSVVEYLELLGFGFDPKTDDALVILWRLYCGSDRRLPNRQQTTGGIR